MKFVERKLYEYGEIIDSVKALSRLYTKKILSNNGGKTAYSKSKNSTKYRGGTGGYLEFMTIE